MTNFLDPLNPVWNYDLIYHIPTKSFYRAWKRELPPNSFKILLIKKYIKDQYGKILPLKYTQDLGRLNSFYWSLPRLDKQERIW